MKRQNTLDKMEMVKQLNWLERKHKRNSQWDNQVKIAFQTSGSFSFDELIHKDKLIAESLIGKFS